MTSNFTRRIGLELFTRHMQNYEPADPVYENYTDEKGRVKRRKRELPPGLSKRDAKILRKVKYRAHHLDKGFRVCGFRFGWAFVIALIPVVGDAADAILNYYLVVRKAKQADIPPWLLNRMLLHNTVSALAGLIPFVGDIVIATYKANSRNAALLEEFLRMRGEEAVKFEREREERERMRKEVEERERRAGPVGALNAGAGRRVDVKEGKEGEVVPVRPENVKGSSFMFWKRKRAAEEKAKTKGEERVSEKERVKEGKST